MENRSETGGTHYITLTLDGFDRFPNALDHEGISETRISSWLDLMCVQRIEKSFPVRPWFGVEGLFYSGPRTCLRVEGDPIVTTGPA